MTITRRRAVLALCAALLAIAAVVIAASSGSKATGTVQALGDTTTGAAVVEALEDTDYVMRYRKVPRLAGYEIVSGEAAQGSHRVQFAVEIRLAGPFESAPRGSEPNPQPPILRYGIEEGGTVVGNIRYATSNNAPAQAGKGIELQPNKAETTMAIHVGVALRDLFASRYRPVG